MIGKLSMSLCKKLIKETFKAFYNHHTIFCGVLFIFDWNIGMVEQNTNIIFPRYTSDTVGCITVSYSVAFAFY